MKRKKEVKMKRNLFLFAVIICLALFLGVLPDDSASAREPYEISIYTLTAGSTTHLFGVTLAGLIKKQSKWLKATAVEGFGPTRNLRMLAAKPEIRSKTLIFSCPGNQWLLEKGRVKGVKPYFDHRQVACWGNPANGFISLNPKITKFEDLKGKRVGVDMKYFFGRATLPLEVIKQYFSLEDINIQYLTPSAGLDALRDKLLDVYFGMGTMISLGEAVPSSPTQAFLDTIREKPYFLSPSPEKVKAGMAAIGGYPAAPVTVAPKTFHPKQDVPWTLMVGSTLTWGADKAMPDDVVYEVTKILYENMPRFAEVHPAGRFLSKETIGLLGVTEDRVHPGALKFYKEVGVKIRSIGRTVGK